MLKKWAGLFLAAAVILSLTVPVFAADTKIDNVKITFSYDKAPASGDSIGSIDADTDSNLFSISSVEYVTDAETWVVGDQPLIRVELTAKDGYRFYYTSKSRFSLSGCSAVFKKARINDGGSSMDVEVNLKRIGGKIGEVENLEWEGNDATWDKQEGAKEYEVRLYREEKLATTVTTAETSYNFASWMNREGDYTFRVRAIAQYNSKAGEWTDDSSSYTVDAQEAGQYNGAGKWVQDSNGWWYSYAAGGYPTACWKMINNAWYYFYSDGYMALGWAKINDIWYYLQPNGTMALGWQQLNGKWYYLEGSGAMLTGWQSINGKWYYLESSGAMTTGWQQIKGFWYYLNDSGAMLTGWQSINGKWYYLSGSGAMYANQRTPDGFYVDNSGAWVQ